MLSIQEYEAKRQARYDRLLAAAEKAEREGSANHNQANSMAQCIPFGQPILVGHYSEKRDRNFRARIENKFRKGYELHQKAEEYKSRAQSVQDNTAIFSDDPEATDKLSEKIAKAEADQTLWKSINAAYKKFLKNPASLDMCELSEGMKKVIREFKPEWSHDLPIPAYRFTNNNANIHRMKERAQVVARKQAAEDKTEEINGVKIEYSPSENRIRIFYPARVPLETYQALKQHGFRVLRSAGEGAFSAYYNNNALYFIKTYILYKKGVE